jgi:trimethylamine--corrinoid protein Co-methyltransferase
MIVLTAEVISMMRRFVDGVKLDVESLALDVIDKVGPGGDFLTAEHTLSHFRDLWQPALMSRERMDGWVSDGRKRLGERLKERTIAILDEHQAEPLTDGVKEEVGYILEGQVPTAS